MDPELLNHIQAILQSLTGTSKPVIQGFNLESKKTDEGRKRIKLYHHTDVCTLDVVISYKEPPSSEVPRLESVMDPPPLPLDLMDMVWTYLGCADIRLEWMRHPSEKHHVATWCSPPFVTQLEDRLFIKHWVRTHRLDVLEEIVRYYESGENTVAKMPKDMSVSTIQLLIVSASVRFNKKKIFEQFFRSHGCDDVLVTIHELDQDKKCKSMDWAMPWIQKELGLIMFGLLKDLSFSVHPFRMIGLSKIKLDMEKILRWIISHGHAEVLSESTLYLIKKQIFTVLRRKPALKSEMEQLLTQIPQEPEEIDSKTLGGVLRQAIAEWNKEQAHSEKE